MAVSSRTSRRSKSVASASGSVSSMPSSPMMNTSGYSTTQESYGYARSSITSTIV